MTVEKIQPKEEQTLRVTAPDMRTIKFRIMGLEPYVPNKWGAKDKQVFRDKMETQVQPGKRQPRPPRDFDQDAQESARMSVDGWYGIPAPGLRAALIDACRLVDMKMNYAKMSIFVQADGYDKDDGMPLVRLYGEPRKIETPVTIGRGTSNLKAALLFENWHADLRVRYDAYQFTDSDVGNLIMRAGEQVGVGRGRAYSKSSGGVGWGAFTVDKRAEKEAV